jgi:hypothetical protein
MSVLQPGKAHSLILAEFLHSQYCIFFRYYFLFVLIDSDDMPDLQKHLETLSGLWFAYDLPPPRYVIVYTSTGVYIHQLLVISM